MSLPFPLVAPLTCGATVSGCAAAAGGSAAAEEEQAEAASIAGGRAGAGGRSRRPRAGGRASTESAAAGGGRGGTEGGGPQAGNGRTSEAGVSVHSEIDRYRWIRDGRSGGVGPLLRMALINFLSPFNALFVFFYFVALL